MKTATSLGVTTLAGLGFIVLSLLLFNPEISKFSGESEAAIILGQVFYLPTLINVAPPANFTHDFETGDLTGTTAGIVQTVDHSDPAVRIDQLSRPL